MSDTQLLTVVLATMPTFLAVLIGILMNNRRLEDVRDLLRAEIQKVDASLTARIDRVENALLSRMADLDTRLARLESK